MALRHAWRERGVGFGTFQYTSHFLSITNICFRLNINWRLERAGPQCKHIKPVQCVLYTDGDLVHINTLLATPKWSFTMSTFTINIYMRGFGARISSYQACRRETLVILHSVLRYIEVAIDELSISRLARARTNERTHSLGRRIVTSSPVRRQCHIVWGPHNHQKYSPSI